MKSGCILSVVLMLGTGFALAGESTDTPAPPAGEPELEVVLVRGEQPGPALWKVSSGDHVLWILGDTAPLPGRMKWRSKQFEKLLARSQEVLLDESDFVPEIRNRREGNKLASIEPLPRPMLLTELTSPGVYARAKALQRKYDIKGKLEWARPWYAASALYYGASYYLRLVDSSVIDSVKRLAGKAQVPITTLSFKPTLEEHIGYLAVATGDDCLLRVVEILEDGGFGLRRLANAWALGDIGQLRELVPAYALVNESWSPSKFDSCKLQGPQRAAEYFGKRTAGWLQESERVLRDNRSTMAVMPIGWLLDPDGIVAQLRARGYEVIEPE